MDAFFAAIEERDRPRLKGKPIVVGADPQGGKGRGIVATANYAARKYGIHSAMPISQAFRASEEARGRGESEVVFIQGNHKKYSAVSDKIYEIIKNQLYDIRCPEAQKIFGTSDVTAKLERASIDEAYFDLSFAGSFENAAEISKKIKGEIKRKEKLTCSIGIGPNKLIAKIASDMQKPDGLTVVYQEEVEKFLEPLPIRKIPGIGPKSEVLLNKKGIRQVKDLKKFSQKELADMMGSPRGDTLKRITLRGAGGLSLYKKIRGTDNSAISSEGSEAKSIGEQETFMTDALDANVLLGALSKISKSVVRSLLKDGFKSFKTIVLTVRFADFKTISRSKTLKEYLSSAEELESTVLNMFLPFLDKRENPSRKKIRLVGVRVEKLKRPL